MKMNLPRVAALGVAVCSAVSVQGQIYKIHNADVAVGATSPFTTVLTTNSTNTQKTTNTTGFLFSFREHPVAWAGIEVNYGYAKRSEVFNYTVNGRSGAARVRTDMHEATGAYLFHPHFKHLQPFIGLGGGAVDFQPIDSGYHQWRGAGLAEVGLDVPMMNPHMGFRIQGRSLVYRAPNFGTPAISTKSWVATSEPSASVYYRF